MKTALVFLLAVACCAAHDLRVCADTDNIERMGGTTFTTTAQLLQTTVKYVTLPDSGFYPADIMCIVVTDQSDNGSSGEVQVVNGGLASKYVNLKFTSNWSMGMKYKIDVYQLKSDNSTASIDEIEAH